jgi:hypothetical protein
MFRLDGPLRYVQKLLKMFVLNKNRLKKEKVQVNVADGVVNWTEIHVSPVPTCFNILQHAFCMLCVGVITTP